VAFAEYPVVRFLTQSFLILRVLLFLLLFFLILLLVCHLNFFVDHPFFSPLRFGLVIGVGLPFTPILIAACGAHTGEASVPEFPHSLASDLVSLEQHSAAALDFPK